MIYCSNKYYYKEECGATRGWGGHGGGGGGGGLSLPAGKLFTPLASAKGLCMPSRQLYMMVLHNYGPGRNTRWYVEQQTMFQWPSCKTDQSTKSLAWPSSMS